MLFAVCWMTIGMRYYGRLAVRDTNESWLARRVLQFACNQPGRFTDIPYLPILPETTAGRTSLPGEHEVQMLNRVPASNRIRRDSAVIRSAGSTNRSDATFRTWSRIVKVKPSLLCRSSSESTLEWRCIALQVEGPDGAVAILFQ